MDAGRSHNILSALEVMNRSVAPPGVFLLLPTKIAASRHLHAGEKLFAPTPVPRMA